MSEKEESVVVIITDTDGNEREYAQDVIIPFQGKDFAALVAIPEKEEDMEEPEIILARIEEEDGEPVYLPPTDEEYEAVSSIYENM